MEWAEETITRLRELWHEGLSTAEIGRRVGFSKNAVVSKAHRLDLPARPSPIHREGQPRPPRPAPRRIGDSTLPPLPSASTPPPNPPATQPTPLTMPRPAVIYEPPPFVDRPPVKAQVTPRPQPEPPQLRPYGRIIECCWPIGEPGTRSFRFCDDPSEPGKSYCEEHTKLAYVKIRDRRGDASGADFRLY